ncbi:MAG: glycosyltransferase [Thermoguttaceae bacterium]|jgi:glycosyltransferase involved in cell wall biosynthesis|nr:glycosyltransferase [Thermoguttaceae bacterium]
MRMIHVIPGLEVRGGGGNRACAELCESLALLGHQVSLYHVGAGDEPCFAPKGVEVRRFPSVLLHRYAYSPALNACLASEVAKADLVHIHALWQYPGLAASRAARAHRVPYVVQPHGSLHPWKLRHKAWRKWLYGRLIERRVLQGAAFVHVESEADACDVLAYLPTARVVTSPCGTFPEVFDDPGPQDYLAKRWPALAGKICILYLARIDVNKGLDLLLYAFAKLAPGRPDLALLIVGPDYSKTTRRMQRLSDALGVSDRVVWGGMVSEQERIWVLRQSDGYVLPSLSENFGISVLEAMFCEKPVITTTATPWAELATAGAGYVVAPEADAIFDALERLVSQPLSSRAEMGRRARRLALAKYDWRAIARKLSRHYEEAVAATGRQGVKP